MPTVPTYESKELPHGNVESAKIPLSYAHLAPSAAIEKAGAEIENIGTQWTQKIQHAEAGAELAKSLAGASVELDTAAKRLTTNADLTEGKPGALDYRSDPTAAQTQYQQSIKDIEQRYRPKNTIAQQMYANHFVGMAAHHMIGVNDWARTTHVQKIAGDYTLASDMFRDQAIAAPTPDLFIEKYKHGLSAIRGKEAAGAIDHKESVNEEREFNKTVLNGRIKKKIWEQNDPEGAIADLTDPEGPYSKLKNKKGEVVWLGLDENSKTARIEEAKKHSTGLMHERRLQENQSEKKRIDAANNDAVDTLKNTWGLKPGAPWENWNHALSDAQDPKWQKEHGLTDVRKQQNPVYNTIKGLMVGAEKQARDNQNEANERGVTARRTGQLKPDQYGTWTDKQTGLGLDENTIEHLQSRDGKSDKAKNTTDHNKYMELKYRITDPERDDKITDINELRKLSRDNIGEKDQEHLEKLLKVQQDPKKHDGFTTAMENYDEVHDKEKKSLLKKGNKDAILAFTQRRNAYEEELVQGVSEGNLKTRHDILDKANELMKNEIYKAKPEGRAEGAAERAENVIKGARKPFPGAAKAEQPAKPTHREKGTGAPVYTLDDGTKVVDRQSKPQHVATDRNTGDPIFQHDDGTMYSVGRSGEVQENQMGAEKPMPDNPVPGKTELPPEMLEHVNQEWKAGYDLHGYIDAHGMPDQSIDPKTGKRKHLTDEFKLPWHWTFSDESKYSKPGQEGGHWENKGTEKKPDWHFYASEFNLTQHSAEELKQHFKENPEDGTLHLPGEKSGVRPRAGGSEVIPDLPEGKEAEGESDTDEKDTGPTEASETERIPEEEPRETNTDEKARAKEEAD